MFVIVGIIVVFGSILVGFVLDHGHLVVLVQWTEFLIIGGAAFGAFLVSNPMSVVTGSFKQILGLLKPNPYNEKAYAELLKVLYDVFQKARKDGLVGLESHIEDPHKSDLFKPYPFFTHHHHALPLLCDTLKVLLTGAVEDHHLAEILDLDLERQHAEAHAVPQALSKIADALPGFGIVAAVLGIVNTMAALEGADTATIGHKVGAALVGTFLGILVSYGFIGPIASAMEAKAAEEGKAFEVVKMALVASVRGYAPSVAVEFARKLLYSEVRPTFADLENELKGRPRAA